MTAPNDEGPTVAAVGLQGVAQAVSHHCAPDDAERKRLDRLRAIAALNGMAVYDLADGSYLLCRWGLSRAVPSVNALSQLFAQMGMSA